MNFATHEAAIWGDDRSGLGIFLPPGAIAGSHTGVFVCEADVTERNPFGANPPESHFYAKE